VGKDDALTRDAVPPPSQVTLMAQQKELYGVSGMEPLTVDRSQGRDWPCVILSLVRSNDKKDVGMLLADWRRLNVALTRAKSKLLVVGSASTVESQAELAQLLSLVRERGWLVPVPREALEVELGTSAA
jgi:superfamily I DNA and/or RNA helicase